jgi:hypothetical protein
VTRPSEGRLKVGSYSPVFQVPEGTSIAVWTHHGNGILDSLGNAIETGGAIDVNRIAGARTYLPGSFMRDYTLSAPYNPTFRMLGYPITVARDTPLSSLVRPGMGNVQWAACLICR